DGLRLRAGYNRTSSFLHCLRREQPKAVVLIEQRTHPFLVAALRSQDAFFRLFGENIFVRRHGTTCLPCSSSLLVPCAAGSRISRLRQPSAERPTASRSGQALRRAGRPGAAPSSARAGCAGPTSPDDRQAGSRLRSARCAASSDAANGVE